MTTDTRDRIINLIRSQGQARAHDLQQALNLGAPAIHRQLKKLVDTGILLKRGKPPIVFYVLSETLSPSSVEEPLISKEARKLVETNFLSITPDGQLLFGLNGFLYWQEHYQKNTPLNVLAEKYLSLFDSEKSLFSPHGYIDATSKLTNTLTEVFIDRLLFQDIYSVPLFGRTKLAKLVMYAKQSGAKELIKTIGNLTKPIVDHIVADFDIDAVAFIPPTVPRPIQFMSELEQVLSLTLPKISLIKVTPGDIPIPQKTLSTVEERVVNAKNSIYLKTTALPSYKNVLLIDDVTGSGASLNETAKKINATGKVAKIIAFTLVGNFKGFDVVREI